MLLFFIIIIVIIIVIVMHQTVTILHEQNDGRGTQLSRLISAVTDDDLLDITGGKGCLTLLGEKVLQKTQPFFLQSPGVLLSKKVQIDTKLYYGCA